MLFRSVYAVVDEPNCSKGENTYQAKDLCKAAMEKILPYLNIYPTADSDKVSSSDGNFTSPEDDEMYDEGSIIEDEQNAADEIRNAANQALNNNGNQNQPEGGDQNQPEGGNQNQPEGGDQNQPEGGNQNQPEGGDQNQPEGGDQNQPADNGGQ